MWGTLNTMDSHARVLDTESPNLESVIEDAKKELLQRQRDDGHWIFEFEADATIPAEYLLLQHFLGTVDEELQAKIAVFLRRIQGDHGGWALFFNGDLDPSATVKAYYALKLAGDSPDAPHMQRARAALLAQGGAAKANVFTRITLALFGQVPWRAVPVMPVEIMLLPQWFPFHLSKVSYWSRTVIAPLLVLMALKPQAKNPKGVDIRELFVKDPEDEDYKMNATGSALGSVFVGIDKVLRAVEPLFPKKSRKLAIDKAIDFIKPRLNGEDGLGGIFPAMANAVMAFEALGYPREHPDFAVARDAIEKLVIVREEEAYCQPCLSPIWDTCLAAHALMEAGEAPDSEAMRRAFDWLLDREIRDVKGDWAWQRPDLAPSGWAFEYRNDYYPDVDDTAVVVMALDRAKDPRNYASVERAAVWIEGMQSRNGGWGSFDADNTYHYLNYIPFADHGALLDPPTVDVTARCISMLCQLGYDRDHPVIKSGLDYLRKEQEADGSWYGRWGINYIYGTWSALSAFNIAGEDMQQPFIRKAVAYLESVQREDGGWGEDCATYWEHRRTEVKASTPSQTAWAVLGLMSAGEVDSDAVRRGVDHLLEQPREKGKWKEDYYTGTGFPRVFYIRYDGYSAYFPLWALARYRNLRQANERRTRYGM